MEAWRFELGRDEVGLLLLVMKIWRFDPGLILSVVFINSSLNSLPPQIAFQLPLIRAFYSHLQLFLFLWTISKIRCLVLEDANPQDWIDLSWPFTKNSGIYFIYILLHGLKTFIQNLDLDRLRYAYLALILKNNGLMTTFSLGPEQLLGVNLFVPYNCTFLINFPSSSLPLIQLQASLYLLQHVTYSPFSWLMNLSLYFEDAVDPMIFNEFTHKFYLMWWCTTTSLNLLGFNSVGHDKSAVIHCLSDAYACIQL